MADDVTRIVYEFSAKGLNEIKQLVDDLRKQVNASGADVGTFESRFDKLERVVQAVSKSLQDVGKSSKTAGSSGKAAGKQVGDSWAAAKKQIDAALKSADKGIKAGTSQQTTSSPLANQNSTAARQWDAEFRKATASAKAFDQQQVQIEKDARATAKAWADIDKQIDAATKKADRGINAATTQQAGSATASKSATNKADLAAWDAQFKSVSQSAAKFQQQQNAIITQRYALYDVATTYTAIGVALAGVATYAAVVGARFESAFTTVERTLQTNATAADVDEIRSSLVNLSLQIPLTFQELSQIATIGNQMGIAKESIVDFTGTIARFSSVSGISIDAVTQAFGTFMAQTGLAPDLLENLGSSIAKVGIDSNATEEQILALMKEITAGAVQAGFAADQIVGLAGTLSSLGIAPERARGALSTYFNTLNLAVAQGGDKLKSFAQIVGVTTDELTNMVKSGQGDEVLRGFLENLQDLDNVDTTKALDDLNLSQLRVSDTFIRLSNQLGIYDRDQRNANEAFMSGAELQRQYAKTIDDLNSQWQIFINGLNAVIDAVTGGAIPGLAALFQMVNGVLGAFTAWLGDNKWAQTVLVIVGVFTALVSVLALINGAAALARGSMLAFAIMQANAARIGVAAQASFRGVAAGLFGVTAAAGTAARALQIFRAALITTGVGALAVGLGILLENLTPVQESVEDNSLSMDQYNDAMSKLSGTSGDVADTSKDAAKGVGGVGKAAKEAAEQVRTLVDYAQDLAGVFDRAADLRFGSQDALDQVTTKWIDLNQSIADYQAKVRTLSADKALKQYFLGIAETYDDQVRAGQLRADIADIDDQLADAQAGASTELKGNTKAAIDNRKTMRDLQGSYFDYIEALARSGASQKEIDKAIKDSKQSFLDQGKALGYSAGELATYGKSFDDMLKIVRAVPKDVTVRFNGDPAQLALNEFFAKTKKDAAAAGAGAGGGLSNALGDNLKIPEVDLGDFFDPLKDAATNAGGEAGGFFSDATRDKFRSYGAGVIYDSVENLFDWASGAVKTPAGKTASEWVRGVTQAYLGKDISNWLMSPFVDAANQYLAYQAGWKIGDSFADGANDRLAKATMKISGGGTRSKVYSSGGYTGPGHWLKPAGIVHAGEYVIPKKHVNQSTGRPDPNYVSRIAGGKPGKAGYAGGGFVGNGLTGPLELGPATLHYLGQAMTVRLGVDSRELASASSRGDSKLARAGSN